VRRPTDFSDERNSIEIAYAKGVERAPVPPALRSGPPDVGLMFCLAEGHGIVVPFRCPPARCVSAVVAHAAPCVEERAAVGEREGSSSSQPPGSSRRGCEDGFEQVFARVTDADAVEFWSDGATFAPGRWQREIAWSGSRKKTAARACVAATRVIA